MDQYISWAANSGAASQEMSRFFVFFVNSSSIIVSALHSAMKASFHIVSNSPWVNNLIIRRYIVCATDSFAKYPPLYPVINHVNPVYILTHCLFRMHFSIVFPSAPVFLSDFPTKVYNPLHLLMKLSVMIITCENTLTCKLSSDEF